MPSPRVMFCGSRGWRDRELVRDRIQCLPEGFVIVTGGAGGLDRMAEAEGNRLGYHVAVVKPLWARRGRRAGMDRNAVLVDLVDPETGWVEAFWDGRSPGTRGAIEIAQKAGLRVVVHRSDGGGSGVREPLPPEAPSPVQGSLL